MHSGGYTYSISATCLKSHVSQITDAEHAVRNTREQTSAHPAQLGALGATLPANM